MMRRFGGWGLLWLWLGAGALGCVPDTGSDSLRFLDPRPGALVFADGASFQLALPAGDGELELQLDGAPLDPALWSRKGRRASGALPPLEEGFHTLRARYAGSLLGVEFPVETSTPFEVVARAGFQVRESVEQLHVTHAEPGTPLWLQSASGRVVAEGLADGQGSYIFRELKPQSGLRIVVDGPPRAATPPLAVMSVAGSQPPDSFYENQVLEPGYGYLTTRDGTKLSIFVSLPGPVEDGPYPTIVNYSGYDPAKPGEVVRVGGLDTTFVCPELPVLCDAPGHPSGLIGGVLGFASVGVNMRGTGCSGGAYDFFEPLQVLDGYDIVEIVAAQDWVLGNKVAMAGLSFPGISQLFVASLKPPGLAAITPLSVISGTDTTLRPGGILNDGFAVEWGQEVLDRADPYGRGWEQGLVDAGDTVCEENQLLHSQKVDIIEKARSLPFTVPEIVDPLNPRNFVHEIEVPVFTAGAWQDEQTGGHFPTLWSRFTSAPLLRATGYNGAHADGYAPQMLAEWKNFLDFTLTGAVRPINVNLVLFGPIFFAEIFGARVGLPDHRFLDFDSFEAALAAYEAEKPVRIIFDNGDGPDVATGAPVGGFEMSFSEWPPAETEARRFYLHGDGSLRPFAPAADDSASSFRHDNAKGQRTYEVNDAFEKALPDIQWPPWRDGRQVVFATPPLTEDLVLVGTASADLWIQSDAADADLEVMLSEIRPDGFETYISSGWLRASHRKLSPESTPLQPVQTHLEVDAAPLPAGTWEPVRVEIYAFAHAFRAGSRLRVSVSTPGGNKGRWRFETLQFDEPVDHAVSHSATHPSSLLLPVIPGVEIPTPLPPCPGLRSQPCREYVPHANAAWD
ncbi:MAG: CocE/NonD family hydrolase [Proteobacteria bacterium]|nr:CocE/NonD family hydrolase [Pseudomonadota bacterium]